MKVVCVQRSFTAKDTCQKINCSTAPSNCRIQLPKVSLNSLKTQLAPKICSFGAAVLLCSSPGLTAGPAHANQKVAEFATSGLIPVPGVFRDTVQVIEFEDPGVEGVTLYFTDYSRSLVEKLAKDPFGDPSQSSVTCVATGTVRVIDPEKAKGDGVEILNELKSLNLLQNKRLLVRRIYDDKNGAVIYVSYSTRFNDNQASTGRYKTSICALPVVR
jgi:catabolite regulation protein CreA